MRSTEDRHARRRSMAALAVAALLVTACDDDLLDSVTGMVTGQGEAADPEATEAADTTEVDEPEPASDDAAGDAGEAGAAEEEPAAQDGPADLASAQAELDPWAVFDEEPFDVELPGLGEAILQLGDQRIEMVTGQCRGGPVYSIMGDPIEASRAAEGVFSFIGGASEGNDLDDLGVLFVLTEGTSGEGFDDEVMIRRAQRLEIIVPDMLPTQIRYLEFLDGSSLDGIETPNTTWAEAPSVRLTRDGLVTAEGTVLRSQSEFVDAPAEVAFAARCSEEWVASIDELEAEHR